MSRRRSGRGSTAGLQRLAEHIVAGDRVVVVCGAGVSAASGIPTFRGADNAVWSEFVVQWGTRAKFLQDPAHWYKAFWHKKFPLGWATSRLPNAAHHALACIGRAHRGVTVVTQNVDGLQRLAAPPLPAAHFTAHGRSTIPQRR